MKINVKKPVKATDVKTAKAPTKAQVTKNTYPKVGSLLYKALRKTALFIANIRKAEIIGDFFVEAPKAVSKAIVIATSEYGVCVSQVQANGGVVQLPELECGANMKAVKGSQVLAPTLAEKYFRKHGKPHVVHMQSDKKGVTQTGYMLGDIAHPYVGFYNAKTREYVTLETRALPDGRNKKRLFELVK